MKYRSRNVLRGRYGLLGNTLAGLRRMHAELLSLREQLRRSAWRGRDLAGARALGQFNLHGADPGGGPGILHALADNAFQFTGLLEADGTLVAVNQAAMNLIQGGKEADIIGRPFWETPWWNHSPFEQHRLRQAVSAAAAGSIVRYEATHLDSGGAIHTVDFSLKPVKDRDGKVIWLIPEGLDVTELRRAKSDLEDVIHSMPGVAFQFRIDTSGAERLTFVSDSVERMFGVRVSDLMADMQTFWARISAEDQGLIRDGFRRSAASGEPACIEIQAISAGGSICWIRVQSSPRRDPDGSHIWNGVLTDITESRSLQQELNETEARFQEVIRAAPSGVHLYRLDSDDRLLFSGANPAADRILGIDHTTLLGKTMEEAFPALTVSGIPDIYRRICAEGGDWSAEQFAVRGGGIKGVFEVHAFNIGPGHCAVIFSDVTERQKTQRALLDSERRFRDFVDNTADGILLIEFHPPVPAGARSGERLRLAQERGIVVECNHAAARLCGLDDRQALIGLRMPDFRRRFQSELLEPAQPAIAGEGRPNFEYRITDARGQARLIDESGFNEVQHGLILRRWSLLRDVTELRRSQDAMSRARQLAEDASRAKSEFLANMSHEIRTPLNAILGTGNLLMESGLTGEQRGILMMLQNATAALTSVVNDVLDFSRIETGKLPIVHERFDLKATLSEAVNMVSLPAREKGLDLDFDYPDIAPTQFIGDSARLRQIVLNLLTNAVKFTASGSVRLAAECPGVISGEVHTLISVADTGQGIEACQLPHIFDRFVQVDTSITREHTGLGLGLSISRRLAELMGGSIEVRSETGKGSVFTLDLLLEIAGPPGPQAKPAQCRTSLRGARILLVEDNHISHRVGRLLLERLGCRVDSATDGAQAVEMALANDYDAVLMDCQMPVLDGLSATREIRARTATSRRVPIIALTAHALESNRRECLAAGMDDYLSKPIDWTEFQRVLARWYAPPSHLDSLA